MFFLCLSLCLFFSAALRKYIALPLTPTSYWLWWCSIGAKSPAGCCYQPGPAILCSGQTLLSIYIHIYIYKYNVHPPITSLFHHVGLLFVVCQVGLSWWVDFILRLNWNFPLRSLTFPLWLAQNVMHYTELLWHPAKIKTFLNFLQHSMALVTEPMLQHG